MENNKKVSIMLEEMEENNLVIKTLYNWPRLTEIKCQNIKTLVERNMMLFDALMKIKSDINEKDLKTITESIEFNEAMIKNVSRRNQIQESKRLESLANWALNIDKVAY